MLQVQALDILKMGHNVFLTGAAGSGKTHTLRTYIEWLRDNNIDVAITASTGIAATHLGGVTIHAWSGLGIRDTLTAQDIELLGEKQYLWKRYESVKVLIIDEISMLHHFRFDLLNRLAQAFKRNDKPFGGMQVVLCGDFFQLPPVARFGEPAALFAYQSKIWNAMNLKICYLDEQHRQNDDQFLNLLNTIRANEVDEGTLEYLKDRFNQEIDPDIFGDIIPTKLYSHNEDVDKINLKALGEISGSEEFFLMDTKGKSNLVEILTKSCLAPMELRLKIGARVMFVKNNYDKGYANGTLGVIDHFDMDHNPVIKVTGGKEITAEQETWSIEEEGKIKAEIKQLPLRLAWAITIHKSQGMSLDAAEIDLSRSFVAGMGYVALSRVKTFAGLKLVGFNPQALQVHPEIIGVDRMLKNKSGETLTELFEINENMGAKTVKELQDDFVREHASDKPIRKSGAENGLIRLSAHEQTKLLILDKLSLAEIAGLRKIKEETVIDHIEKLLEEGILEKELIDISYLKDSEYRDPKSRLMFSKIKDAFGEISHKNPAKYPLSPVKNKLGNKFSYKDIRLARVFILAGI